MPGNPTSHHGGGGISRREHQHREIETQEGFQKKPLKLILIGFQSLIAHWLSNDWIPISIKMKTDLSQQEMKLIQCMLYQ